MSQYNDPFKNRMHDLSGPARDLVPVVPDDGADLPSVAVALYVETGGDLVVTTYAGAERTVKVPDNFTFQVGVRRVFATGTTAAGIHAYTAS